MQRENVQENFSHYEPPRVLRVLVDSGKYYLATLQRRARTIGITAKDGTDLQFALDHWRLISLEIGSEPHEDIMRLRDCEDNIRWFESTLAMAIADRGTKT